MNTVNLNSGNFKKEVMDSQTPVLVDFYADWCGPCRMLTPVIEELAKKYAGKLKVCKLNVDEAGDIAGEYSVSSIPTVILFKNGQAADQFMGAVPKQIVEEFITNNI